jgi:hypothetical protein
MFYMSSATIPKHKLEPLFQHCSRHTCPHPPSEPPFTVVAAVHGQKRKDLTAFVSRGSPSVVPTVAAILAGDQR